MYKKKILYLTQTYPFPANDGGEQGLQIHVLELENSKFANNIKMFFSLFNKSNYTIKNLKIDNRIFEIRKYKNKLSKYVIEFFEFFTSKYSRSYHLVDTKELRNAIKEYNPDIVILDHVGCYKTLKNVKYKGKLIYIEHNIEATFHFDNAKLQKNLVKKFIRYIGGVKAFFTEKSIMQQADIIGCISVSDYNIISRKYKPKTFLCTPVPEKQDIEWTGKNEKTLFFCGPYDFYPNKDAINWIINDLAPKMPDIKFKIAGKDTDKLSVNINNVECLGFVPKEQLIDLYINSSAFICPIIYGSGIKMKMVEALSYYTPVIATKESLSGMGNINIDVLINRDNIIQTVNIISRLINDRASLIEFQQIIKKNVLSMREKRNSIDDIIGMVIKN